MVSFLSELRRRNVLRVAAFYAAAGWLLVQVATQVFPFFEIPNWVVRVVVIAITLGFPASLVFAWFYELTPEGLKLESEVAPGESITHQTGRKLDRWIIAALALAVVLLVANSLVSHKPAVSTQTASVVSDKSVAVLPFENLSEDKSNAYFAEGIQDQILTQLAKVSALKVISRISTRRYASSPDNLPEIAKQLGVANVLEGSVQKAGDQVLINVQLIHAQSDMHLWAESYNRKLVDVFAVEAEVAGAVARALNAKLTESEQQELAQAPTNNTAAYDAYLRGLAYFNRPGLDESKDLNVVQSLDEAVKRDPTFAIAWALLAREHSEFFWSFETPANRRDDARRALDIATRLQPNLRETLLAQGVFAYYVDRNFDSAKQAFERVRTQWPNDSDAVVNLAYIARRQGRWNDSLSLCDQAVLLDPQNPNVLSDASDTYMATRNLQRSLKLLNRALDFAPDNPKILSRKAKIYQMAGELDQADAVITTILADPGAKDEVIWSMVPQARLTRHYAPAIEALKSFLVTPQALALGREIIHGYHGLGDLQRFAGDAAGAHASYERAREPLQGYQRERPDSAHLTATLAGVYSGLGNKTQALELAERAVALLPASMDALHGPLYEENLARIEARFGENDRAIKALQHLLGVPYFGAITPAILRLDPDFDKLRSDHRFQVLADGPEPEKP